MRKNTFTVYELLLKDVCEMSTNVGTYFHFMFNTISLMRCFLIILFLNVYLFFLNRKAIFKLIYYKNKIFYTTLILSYLSNITLFPNEKKITNNLYAIK